MWLNLASSVPAVSLPAGFNKLLIVAIHCQMLPSVCGTFQSDKMVILLLLLLMMMITPMFVCLYDQQDPLCVSSCLLPFPICTAPNNYVTYVVMFCRQREPLPFSKYLQQNTKATTTLQ
jgi:hypothetical protein